MPDINKSTTIKERSGAMEYAVFQEPGIDLWWIVSVAFLVLATFSWILARQSAHVHQEKRKLFGDTKFPANKEPGVVLVAIGFVFLIVMIWSAIVALVTSEKVADDCYLEQYAGEGIYRIAEASIVYHTTSSTAYENGNLLYDKFGKRLYVYTPTNPDYFQLYLEGRLGPPHPSDLRVVRCIAVPYDKVIEKQRFAITTPEKNTEEKKARTQQVKLPSYAVKYPGGLWKFVDQPSQ